MSFWQFTPLAGGTGPRLPTTFNMPRSETCPNSVPAVRHGQAKMLFSHCGTLGGSGHGNECPRGPPQQALHNFFNVFLKRSALVLRKRLTEKIFTKP